MAYSLSLSQGQALATTACIVTNNTIIFDRNFFYVSSSASSLTNNATISGLTRQLSALSADAEAGWLHEYLHSPIVSVASLSGVGYVVNTARLPSNGAQVGLGATLQQSDNVSIRPEYQGDIRDGYVSHTGLLKLRESF